MCLLDPREAHELCDVMSFHPYPGWWNGGELFAESLEPFIELANQLHKPLICTETCQGSLSNETRRQIIEVSLRTLEQHQIGWLAFQLMAGKSVTARWDRRDRNCRPGDESVMYWVERDGSTRPCHDVSQWRTW
jgi:hypothetical protein